MRSSVRDRRCSISARAAASSALSPVVRVSPSSAAWPTDKFAVLVEYPCGALKGLDDSAQALDLALQLGSLVCEMRHEV